MADKSHRIQGIGNGVPMTHHPAPMRPSRAVRALENWPEQLSIYSTCSTFGSLAGGVIGPCSTAIGKPCDFRSPSQSVQEQFTLSPWKSLTVIRGPPERTRTRSPVCKEAMEPLCIKTGSAKAGIIADEKPSAIPSAIANTTEFDLLKLDIL